MALNDRYTMILGHLGNVGLYLRRYFVALPGECI
jgi:hypothetical protein